MNKFDDLDLGYSGKREPLPVGVYGDKIRPGLQILSYIGAKPTKPDEELIQHSFLVASTNEVEGTAFLSFNLKESWRKDAVVAVVFNKPELVDPEDYKKVEAILYDIAVRKAIAAGTPRDQLDTTCEHAHKKLLDQIRITIGTIFRLQDWKGVERNQTAQLSSLVGTRFSGNIEPGLTKDTVQVKSVFSKKFVGA